MGEVRASYGLRHASLGGKPGAWARKRDWDCSLGVRVRKRDLLMEVVLKEDWGTSRWKASVENEVGKGGVRRLVVVCDLVAMEKGFE
ncbi:unnamed protein product [Dovyalis caffra]|uniref:Uncharacterized protein n=1 Tax=Dovyalis caffra TaxID=77055 RepID=A0AAV1RME8_9ROSI|nr:unnamed protein product [Dovyalis caffra]